MRKITFFKTLLVAIALIVGSASASAQEVSIYTTGFEASEGFGVSTVYNNVTPIIFGSTQSWSVIMGSVTTTGFITGAQSLQMRSYAGTTTLGSATMNFDLPYVTKVTFNAIAYNSSITSFNAYYSTDYGVTWSAPTSISVGTTKTACTYTVSTTGAYKAVRIKIENQTNNVASRLTIDDVIVYGMTPANPLAVAPVISLASGKYISQQNVTLTSTTPGSTIYYTTDGTTPSDASSAYTSTFSVNSSMTVKAITYAPSYDASLLSMATYTYPTNISNIALLKAADVSGFYRLTGEAILTFQAPATSAKPKYVQDATGGIMIYDSGSKIVTAYNLYDGITGLIGTLSPYNGMVEFVPFTDPGAASSTANVVTPIVVNVANLANYSGQLVKVKNVTITPTGTFAATTLYTMTDATSATGKLRTAYVVADLPYIGSAIPTAAQDITGVVLTYSTTEADLIPRTAADMIFSQTITSTTTGGLWSATTTWVGGVVPVAANDVVIADGATVTIDAAVTVASIKVGQGTSGTLIFNSTAHAVIVNGNVTVATGGKFGTGILTTGDITLGSTTLTNVASTVGVVVGMTITGTNIPASTTVTAFDATTITLSAAPITATTIGATLTIGAAVATNTMSIAGNLTNNGTFDMSLGSSDKICTVTFNGLSGVEQDISGTATGTATRFRGIVLNRSLKTDLVKATIDVYSAGSTSTGLVFTTGTWEQYHGTLYNTSGSQTLASANGGLIIDGDGNYNSLINGSLAVSPGFLTINTSGTVGIGLSPSNANNITVSSGTLTIQKGTINIYGYFKNSSGTIAISENGGAGTTNINIRNLSAGNNSFDIPSTGNFTMSGGTVTIVDPLSSATASKVDVNMSTSAVNNITGGTIVIGDGSSTNQGNTAGKGFFINTHTVPLWNLVINAGTTAGRQVTLGDNGTTLAARDLVVKNNLTITSGTLNANAATTGSNITVGGAFTNSGTFTGGTTSGYTFNGSSAQTTGALPGSIPKLTINNAAGVALSQATTVAGALTLTSGTLSLGANNLTVGSISGASAAKYVVTSGTGTLTQPVTAAGTVVFPIGASATSYDPVSVTPVSATNFTAKVGTTLSGIAASGVEYNAKEWNLSSSAPSSTLVALTPSVVTALSYPTQIIGHYVSGAYTNVTASLSGNTYSATFDTFSPFVTGDQLGTGINPATIGGVSFYGQIIHNNANVDLQVFDITGRKVVSSNKNINMSSNPTGIYIVKGVNGTLKITVTK